MDWVVAHEGDVRLAAFLSVLLLMLALEALRPRRVMPLHRRLRWSANFGIVLLDTVLVRLLIPMGAVGVALWAQQSHIGLFQLTDLPFWIEVLLSFLALDCLIYWQHRFFHWAPALWRLHRTHHSDIEFDTTTAVRFHPVEILISMLIKMAAVAALGAPAIAVIVFEIALNGTAMFNHANLRLPASLDAALRLIVVTPDLHRTHHSVHRGEHDSNFGFNLPWWDRMFGSYTPQPRDGHTGMTIGLSQFREPGAQRLDALLVQPLRD